MEEGVGVLQTVEEVVAEADHLKRKEQFQGLYEVVKFWFTKWENITLNFFLIRKNKTCFKSAEKTGLPAPIWQDKKRRGE